MFSCHSRCAYSISEVYLMFPSKVAICLYTLAILLPLFLFSTDFKERGQHLMILIDFHELQIDCLVFKPAFQPFTVCSSSWWYLNCGPPEDKTRAKHRNHGKWRDAVHVHNSHSKCKGNQEPLRGTLSLFPPKPGSHTFTGPCVWVWCHPAPEAIFFYRGQMCTLCAVSFPGDRSHWRRRVRKHVQEMHEGNSWHFSLIDFCFISDNLFNVGC